MLSCAGVPPTHTRRRHPPGVTTAGVHPRGAHLPTTGLHAQVLRWAARLQHQTTQQSGLTAALQLYRSRCVPFTKHALLRVCTKFATALIKMFIVHISDYISIWQLSVSIVFQSCDIELIHGCRYFLNHRMNHTIKICYHFHCVVWNCKQLVNKSNQRISCHALYPNRINSKNCEILEI